MPLGILLTNHSIVSSLYYTSLYNFHKGPGKFILYLSPKTLNPICIDVNPFSALLQGSSNLGVSTACQKLFQRHHFNGLGALLAPTFSPRTWLVFPYRVQGPLYDFGPFSPTVNNGHFEEKLT